MKNKKIDNIDNQELIALYHKLNDMWTIRVSDVVQVTDQFIDLQIATLTDMDITGDIQKRMITQRLNPMANGNEDQDMMIPQFSISEEYMSALNAKMTRHNALRQDYLSNYSVNRWMVYDKTKNKVIKKSFFVQEIVRDPMRPSPNEKIMALVMCEDDRCIVPTIYLKKVADLNINNQPITNSTNNDFLPSGDIFDAIAKSIASESNLECGDRSNPLEDLDNN